MELKVLAIDPGVTTGIAFAEIRSRDEKISEAHVWLEEHRFSLLQLWQVLMDIGPSHIICESFEFRQRARTNLVLESRDAIGVIRLFVEMYEKTAPSHPKLHMQTAAYGKGYFSDQVLKKIGLYDPGKHHARDAERHLLHWLTFGYGFQFNAADNITLGRG